MFLLLAVRYVHEADVDAAYRRIPLRVDHMWACAIVALLGGQVREMWEMQGDCREIEARYREMEGRCREM